MAIRGTVKVLTRPIAALELACRKYMTVAGPACVPCWSQSLLLSAASVSLADSPLRILPVDDRPDGFSRLFNRQVDVFGLTVYATKNVPDPKLIHAARLDF